MLDKSRILYKGDMLAAYFYIFVGVLLMISALGLLKFTSTPGFYYLSLGFILFFVYCLGKGMFMIYLYGHKYRFFRDLTSMTSLVIEDEKTFTEYRIHKKNVNRRRYVYIIILGTVAAFTGIFIPQKSIIMGTSIPIALIAGIEFSVGLLTEFRLREYLRVISRTEEESHHGNDNL